MGRKGGTGGKEKRNGREGKEKLEGRKRGTGGKEKRNGREGKEELEGRKGGTGGKERRNYTYIYLKMIKNILEPFYIENKNVSNK